MFGDEAAKIILSLPQQYDLFIVGHAAPEKSRKEMVEWLKARYPKVPVLALNPPRATEIPEADYNVRLNGPEVWLSMIETAMNRPQ